MLNFASYYVAGSVAGLRTRSDSHRPTNAALECSDDEVSSVDSTGEGLECPICWESFNIVENVPYVLWCGHSLCKNCILGLQWAVLKVPSLPLQLPLFISCPWCNLLSFRLVYKGNLKFPRKNYFLLWMVESLNGDRRRSNSSYFEDHHTSCPSGNLSEQNQMTRGTQRTGQHFERSELPGGSYQNYYNNYLSLERAQDSLRKSLVFFLHMTAKFPLVIIFLLIVLYAIPASAAILALYILVTILFAVPSFLILYFAYPSLYWLVREIVT